MPEPVRHVVPVTTHGCYLTAAPETGGPHPVLVGFHGYAQNAAWMLGALAALDPDERWLRVSVQGLHRFYAKDNGVVASWMTREDREAAIADNIAYGLQVQREVTAAFVVRAPLVLAGFSQGVAQAYRVAAALGSACHGVIALAGDVPPDVAPVAATLPPVLLGRGSADAWYTAATFDADAATLRAAGVRLETCAFDAGHEWAPAFAAAARRWLSALDQSRG